MICALLNNNKYLFRLFIFYKIYNLPEVDAEFVTDCNDLSRVCRSLVCKNKNKVDEIAISATSSLVLKTKTFLLYN